MTPYSERLWPPVSLWVVGWLFVVSLGVSFYAALGLVGGALATAGAGALLMWGLVASAARITVSEGQLTAGSATIPVSLLGDVEILDAHSAREVRGPASDPAAYHLIRGWVAEGIRAPVEDPADPTPYWFVASRQPAELAAAIDSERRV